VSIAKGGGMHVWLSSNLSLPKLPNLEKTLMAGVDLLTVSVSGETQKIHEINHKCSDIVNVFTHLRFISNLLFEKKIQTTVNLRLIKFTYNQSSEYALSNFAKELGINFEVILGIGNPLSNTGAAVDFLGFNPYLLSRQVIVPQFNSGICELILQHVAIDYRGNTYICCSKPYGVGTKIAKYLEIQPDELFMRRFIHPFCKQCNFKRVPLLENEIEWLSSKLDTENSDMYDHDYKYLENSKGIWKLSKLFDLWKTKNSK